MVKRSLALAAILSCVLVWGFSFISIKIAVNVFPPMTLGAVRFAIALVFLYILKKKKAPDEKIKKQDIPLLAGAGLTGVTLYFFFENNAVYLIPASEASIITAAIPVLILIADNIGDKIASSRNRNHGNSINTSANTRERLLSRVILPGLAALISITGVGLVAGVSFALSGTALGYLYMSGTCISWVLYCFLTRPLFSQHSRIFIVFWQSAIGFLGFLPFAFLELRTIWHSLITQMPGIDVWGHVLFLGIFCSAMGYWFYSISLQTLGLGTSSLFINFIPVVSAVGGYFVLGERLSPLQWLGAALVLAGVYLAMAVPNIIKKKNNSI